MSTGNGYSVSDIEKAILNDLGVSVSIPDAPGRFIRFDVRKRGDKAGWCVYYVNAHCVVARYGSWLTGQHFEWINKDKKEISPEIRKEKAESRRRAEEARRAEQDKIAVEAADLYASLPEASEEFPYLVRKGVRNHGGLLRYDAEGDYMGPHIVIPLFNIEGEIRSVERIYPDGRKRFYPGGEKKGCFCVIGKLKDRAFLCEGYATGASIYEATDIPVVVAFDCHNLKPVADALRDKVKLICVADNDAKESGANPGLECAWETGLYYVLIPEAGMDANDYANAFGKDALKNLLCPTKSEWIEDGNDFLTQPAPTEWLVKNWFARRSLGMIFGAPNSGKSFVALDICLTITTGLGSWHGYKARKGKVLYLCGEGNAGLRKRVALWAQVHGVTTLGTFSVTKSPRRINEGSELAYVEDQIELSGLVPDLIVIDTLNMHFSGNENDAQDMGGFIYAAKELVERYSCTVIIIHHTGVSKDAEGRARGSSALNAALDTAVCVQNNNGYLTLEQTKQKDAERLVPVMLHLAGKVIDGWLDEDGEPVTSAFIESVEEAELNTPGVLPAGKEMSMLTDAWLWSGCGIKKGYPTLMKGELRTYLREELKWDRNQVKSAFYTDTPSRFLRKLQESCRIEVEEEQIFIVNSADITVCFLLEKEGKQHEQH